MAMGTTITNFNSQAADQQAYLHNAILSRGVTNQSLNKEEFLDLNNDLNSVNQLRDTFAKDGISPEEQQILDARQMAYSNKLDQYRGGDFKPAVVSANPYDKAQNEQAGSIYDGLKEGTINQDEALKLLSLQRNMAKGSLQRNPNDQQQMLNESEFEIYLARKDKQPAPPAPTPQPFPIFPTPTFSPLGTIGGALGLGLRLAQPPGGHISAGTNSRPPSTLEQFR